MTFTIYRNYLNRGFLLFVLTCSVPLMAAEKYRYRFVNLSTIELPTGTFGFFPVALSEKGEVYGNLITDESFLHSEIATYKEGKIEVVPGSNNQMSPISVNNKKTVLATQFEPVFEGGILIDFIFRNLLLNNGQIKFLPDPVTQFNFFGMDLNDRNQVLFYHSIFEHDYDIYSQGILRTGHFNLPPDVFVFFRGEFSGSFVGEADIFNSKGEIAGMYSKRFPSQFDEIFAFRHNTSTGVTQTLRPLPNNRFAWGLAINKTGNVLGYSFDFFPSYQENIGVWDRQGNFKTFFTETNALNSSNTLVFNDKNEIVVSDVRFQDFKENSYLIPKPGVRLLLTDLVENLPDGQKLEYISDINNHGDMLGLTITDNEDGSLTFTDFLLERLDDDEVAGPTSAMRATTAKLNMTSKHTNQILPSILRQRIPERAKPTKAEYFLKLHGLMP